MTAPGPDADLEPFLTPDDLADEAPGPRLMALSCDHPDDECGADLRCDVLARSFAEALPALIAYGREQGWSVTNDGRTAYCPDHWPVVPAVPVDGPWWHAFGRELSLAGGTVWQLTVISPSTVAPAAAAALASDTWGAYLTSWDHEPTDDERDALTPAAHRDDVDAVQATLLGTPGTGEG